MPGHVRTGIIRLTWLVVLLAACAENSGPGSGDLDVMVQTSGYSTDADGYNVRLNGTEVGQLSPQDTLTLSNVAPGQYQVEIAGISNNCQAQPNSLRVEILPGGQGGASFTVSCDSVLRGVILFTRIIPGPEGAPGTSDIYQIRPDGSGLAWVAAGGRATASPDGRYLVLTRVGPVFSTFRMDADGTRLVDLTPDTPEDQCPVWSPDGSRIAFSSKRSGEWQLYTMRPDGSDQQRLTFSNQQEICAQWSPDGSRLVFSRSLPDYSSPAIFVINADGTGELALTDFVPGGDSGPAWSPDGTKIIFNSGRSGTNQLWVMNADGSSPQPLTDTPQFSYGEPFWSPDGREVVFGRGGVNFPTVYRMRSDGAGLVTPLTTGPDHDTPSQWLP